MLFRCVLSVLAGLVLATGAAAQNNVDAAFVREAIARGAIVWDVRPTPEYLKGHLPGAVSVGEVGRVLRDPNREDFLPTPVIESILGGAGIDPRAEIIVYGSTGNPAAAFAQHTILYFGGRRARIYHAGFEDWVARGGAVETSPSRRPAVALSLKEDPSTFVTTDEVIRMTGSANVQIVDSRTPEEFKGNDIRAIRGGHVPGAVNIPYEQNWKDPETPAKLARKEAKDSSGMDLKETGALRALYAKLDPAKETVVYCQSGVRAAQTAAVLRDLGFRNVRVYESSWLGYAAKLSAPVQNETFFNVGALTARLSGMQRRLEQLEKELAAERAKAGAK